MTVSAQGEDRSAYQPVISWTGLSFGFAKATEGTGWTDPAFAANWAVMRRQRNIIRGAYHFFHPGLPAEEQAAFFMATVAKYGLAPGDMLAVDAEISTGLDGTLLMDPARTGRSALLEPGADGRAVIRPGMRYPRRLLNRRAPRKTGLSAGSGARQFLDDVAAAVRVLLGGDHCRILCYTYLDFLPALTTCTPYPLWIADYSPTAPACVLPWREWAIWQYAGGGGQGGSDQDAYNGTAAGLQAWARAAPPAPLPVHIPNWTEKIVHTLPTLTTGAAGEDVKTVQGLLGARGHPVTIDGALGPATGAAIRAFQADSGLTQDGIAGPLTWQALLHR